MKQLLVQFSETLVKIIHAVNSQNALSDSKVMVPLLSRPQEIFKWQRSIQQLQDLYKELITRQYINCTYEEFASIFSAKPTKIVWYSSYKNLAYLLIKFNLFAIIKRSNKLHILIASNFLGKKGQPIRVTSMKSTLTRVRDMAPDKDLDLIIAPYRSTESSVNNR